LDLYRKLKETQVRIDKLKGQGNLDNSKHMIAMTLLDYDRPNASRNVHGVSSILALG